MKVCRIFCVLILVSLLKQRALAQTYAELLEEFEILKEEFQSLKDFIVRMQKSSTNCDDLYNHGIRTDGNYFINVNGEVLTVYCEFNDSYTGLSWLVIQRRTTGDVDFYRNWKNYTEGFGYYHDEFWLGLENIHLITSSKSYRLRVDLVDFDNNTAHVEYAEFIVKDSSTNYTLSVNASGVDGPAGDGLTYHNNMQFSTYDMDNDPWTGNCAEARTGAWWYNECCVSNLNGKYLTDGAIHYGGMHWFYWKNNAYSLRSVEMKIRPNDEE